MTHGYIIINQQFAQAHQGYENHGLRFNYAITNQGDYVCSENSIKEFPELFENSPYLFSIARIDLTPEDFPQIL